MIPKNIVLEDGRTATISFISIKDSVREFRAYINELVEEDAKITIDTKISLKEETAWKRDQLSRQRKRSGYLLVAKVDGKLAGSSGASRERGRGSGNIMLGISIARPFRGIGLGETLLKTNMLLAKDFFRPKPKNIYLSVLATNKPARSLYTKLGFRGFAIFPRWVFHSGRYVDHIVMKL